MEIIEKVGAFAGLAAFLGLAVLALLYFVQARDVRRLRENAEFLVEDGPMPTHPEDADEEDDAQATAPRSAAAAGGTDAEKFRRAELARQAAERRERFEGRRSGEDGRGLPELRSLAVMIIGAVILLAGIGFGLMQLVGGDDDPAGGNAGGGKGGACPPGQTKVAVLNSTAETGLAAGFAQDLKDRQYQVGPISNTTTPFETSVVMFDQKSGEACATAVAPIVDITGTEPMNDEIREISEGAVVSVVLGEDKAPGASSSTDSAVGDTTTEPTIGE